MKTFERTWGDGYPTVDGKPDTDICRVNAFCNEGGYLDAAIRAVLNLDVGEIADLTDICGTHSVRRLT